MQNWEKCNSTRLDGHEEAQPFVNLSIEKEDKSKITHTYSQDIDRSASKEYVTFDIPHFEIMRFSQHILTISCNDLKIKIKYFIKMFASVKTIIIHISQHDIFLSEHVILYVLPGTTIRINIISLSTFMFSMLAGAEGVRKSFHAISKNSSQRSILCLHHVVL